MVHAHRDGAARRPLTDARAAIGLPSGTVVVAPYDDRWPGLYAAEARRIGEVLEAHGIELRLEHTGSTAVPGLDAKPIIDILAGRSASSERDAVIRAIESAGYTYRGEQGIPGRDFFSRGDPRSYHLHLTTMDSDFWRAHRGFRDFLRAHPDVAAQYARLKHELAARFPRDREAYIEGKAAFVRGVVERALSR